MDDLKLKCALAGQTADMMHIEPAEEGDNGEFVCATVIDGSATASFYFTEDTARQLFNWLGVRLHGGANRQVT